MDRASLIADWNSTRLVGKVAAECANTIVVIHGTGPVAIPWVDNGGITAVLLAHLPGQEIGISIVDILYGVTNPFGNLEYTIAKKEPDCLYNIANTTELMISNGPNAWQGDFTEGRLIDYHCFDSINASV